MLYCKVDADRAAADLRSITSLLQSQPTKIGESRETEQQRVVFLGTLAILYLVDEQTKTVFILTIRCSSK